LKRQGPRLYMGTKFQYILIIAKRSCFILCLCEIFKKINPGFDTYLIPTKKQLIAGAYFLIPKGKAGLETFITVSRNKGRKDSKFQKTKYPSESLSTPSRCFGTSGHSPLFTLHSSLFKSQINELTKPIYFRENFFNHFHDSTLKNS
jgi:hypothetical protein